MSSETGFALLIARDIRRSMSSGKPNRHWRLVYAAAAVLALAVVATYESTQHTMVLSSITPVWTISFYIPIISFGFPMALVMNEWRQNTVGWWLTLPLPRFQLAAAKCLVMSEKPHESRCGHFLAFPFWGSMRVS
ncbi:hypothetical protein GCM10025858_21660 [Alicyclobacillus sacchari]|uniref:hypothetical protein n=1 Tax=Alicyclobacillus sacchari TaxID=392010 RepID=UPI0023EA0C4F|nr:hypothetical protein [Alicyclobacillus sacchari]GMA57663.1 hypothetical protein GCM10025858_21660 [Alicyclobacillus sacchari]